MKDTLKEGMEYTHKFTITPAQTVPALYPEAEELSVMPEVFATGFLVGLIEWTCIKAVNPYLDWPQEQTVGTHLDISHSAATPVGFEVTVTVRLDWFDERKLEFDFEAHDGVHLISQGRHERYIILKEKFDAKLDQKRERAKR